MFDIGWSELLIIAVATLIVVGPKDLPVFLRTIGRYIGVLKRQASEFRSQFDDALRETEFDQIRQDVQNIKSDVTQSITATTTHLTDELSDAQKTLDEAVKDDTATYASVFGSSVPTGTDKSVEAAVAETKLTDDTLDVTHPDALTGDSWSTQDQQATEAGNKDLVAETPASQEASDVAGEDEVEQTSEKQAAERSGA